MKVNNDIRRGRHCTFNMHVHLVFVAKYRRKVFDKEAIDRLRELFTKVCNDFEAQLAEMDGERDHVHLLVSYPPKVAVSALVNSLKGASSRVLRKERPVQQHYTRALSENAWILSDLAILASVRKFRKEDPSGQPR